MGRVDIITGTLGKALVGGNGGIPQQKKENRNIASTIKTLFVF